MVHAAESQSSVPKLAFLVVLLFACGCDRTAAEGRGAEENARGKGPALVQIPFSQTFPIGKIECVRAESLASQVLLFRESYNGRVFEVDTATNRIAQASAAAWEAATGDIADRHQIGPTTGHPPYNEQLSKLVGSGQEIRVTGAYVMEVVWSPRRDKVTVVSADGRFHPPERGIGLLGGRSAYADGQHYVELRDSKTGSLLAPGVAVPRFEREWMDLWWTADERFVVCLYSNHKLLIVPTGLPPAPSLVTSPQEARERKIAIFQPARWWQSWIHGNTFRVRYEAVESPALLMSTGPGGGIYRYDPDARSLSVTDRAAWNRASGVEYGPAALFADRKRPSNDDYDVAAEIEKANSKSPRKREDLIDWQIGHCRKIARPAGPRQLLYLPAPGKDRVLIASDHGDESPDVFLQFFDPRFCQALGETIHMPRRIWQEIGRPIWIPDGRYILFDGRERHYLTVIHTDLLP